ncbi:hypothetical protein TWF569_001659 [Orbilia oligospora]|uniref:Ubiquitin carboxyl-terminal hydrolase n=1 Tax=Orbilia oligospora TaxID=2813651 RepID=A0A7C8NHA6_ORBOL|nr:hypothetical protein TWF706_002773 [Orbilia oligospora]KAF3121358.1 hypothetical protein TWF703_001950 [Orbilia oligospora]KAF3123043.1 hypothetical protein TWF594_002550 [Orbilia oligospora]KAF3123737.1 hypothetical protein TWF569_001659 [Orbilia oligospora]
MPNTFYRPSHLQPNVPPYYPPQEIHQPPADIPSPASLPREPVVSNPASSPAQSTKPIEESCETKYGTPTSPSPILYSPMVPIVVPLQEGHEFNPLRLPWFSAPDKPFPFRKPKTVKTKDTVPQKTTPPDPNSLLATRPSTSDPPLGNIISLTTETKDNISAELESNEQNTVIGSDIATSPSTDRALKLANTSAFTIPTIPVVPFIPAIHKPRKSADATPVPSDLERAQGFAGETEALEDSKENGAQTAMEDQPPPPPPPKSWADLVRSKAAKISTTPNPSVLPGTNGLSIASGNLGDTQTRTLAEVLQTFDITQLRGSGSGWKVPLMEPRGLINTGNMCFMNSILQALLFCGPFFLFLDAVSRKVAHNFKNETPLIDAMIMFMREFRRVTPGSLLSSDSPISDMTLSGDPFVPEYVYEAVKGLKRFSSMRRGHQQDAEEFLNFFLDVLHEECVAAIKSGEGSKQGSAAHPNYTATPSQEDDSGWLEVGHKQKTTITRNIGHISGISPVTKIFGGQMRNELRISGQRSSVMREPYQSLQLDIQNSNIHSIVDALRQISIPEQLQGGDFKSARGASASATKQAFIDSLPPVLILHLKRFQYNNTGGTQKIWKSIGYPLDLEIPSEALSPTRRSSAQPARYKLTSVVYHHGKSATNGHYTVDVKRQDGWIRIDDTVVKRITGNDVVVNDGLYNLEPRKRVVSEENGWKEVNFATKVSGKAMTATNNSSRDDKVAYLLFYELQ